MSTAERCPILCARSCHTHVGTIAELFRLPLVLKKSSVDTVEERTSACVNSPGVQANSAKTQMLAAVRFSPVPAALMETMATRRVLLRWNSRTRS